MATKLSIPKNSFSPEEVVWVRAWCATASAISCQNTETAARWADACLKDFRQRFRKSEGEKPE